MLSRRVTQISQVHGIRARISSLVDVGASSPYRLPLLLAQPASQSLQYNKPGQFIPSPPIPFQEDPGWTTLSIVCRVTDPPKAVQDSSYRVQSQTLSIIQTSQATQLPDEVLSENIEPPQPEKPKWEDEQYPDIGKSTFLQVSLIIAIDILSNQLPFIFIQPLPKSILSPKIELRLFPSSYPSIPAVRIGRFLYRTISRAVRWVAPVFLNRSLRSFGNPSGIKGIGLEITCLRVEKIENGRRVEARWRTASSPWSTKQESSAPTNTVEDMPQTWSGWFYFDINRKGLIVKHVVENVNNQRKEEGRVT